MIRPEISVGIACRSEIDAIARTSRDLIESGMAVDAGKGRRQPASPGYVAVVRYPDRVAGFGIMQAFGAAAWAGESRRLIG